ncbi:uncharacterized protein LOC118184895 [Stegodyphus dumicola]|uniref:uncharacterized protein LOC118184895 n=1 Tax=Stegodyphus dumicola TaxID=202533 RepID=UPI0015A84B9A|nr:uncharacterized protein LOC118184895 [Stegodyphus dumicola]
MFHHYTENYSSTGEPPTPPAEESTILRTSNDGVSRSSTSSERQTNASTSSSRSQEDSGYEASPSSYNRSNRLHFFGIQSDETANQIVQASTSGHHLEAAGEENDFEDCPAVFLLEESETESDAELDDEWDMCPDCNSTFCYGCYGTDSSLNNATSTAIATDLSKCDNSSISSDLSSSNRPSSLPIQIPNVQIQNEMPSNYAASPSRLQPSRSDPIDFGSYSPVLRTVSLIARSHPVSWPSSIAAWAAQRGPLPFLLSNIDNIRQAFRDDLSNSRRSEGAPSNSRRHELSPSNAARLNRAPSHSRRLDQLHGRSRRQLIDSDASSLHSSDDDTVEDVFNMAETNSSSYALVANGQPLPDVVLQSSPSVSRRIRSLSVNLPPTQEVLQRIGRSLRDLSDQFERGREISQRRRTIADIIF